ncbi:uncharacterized protein EI97DRAFT_62785 [Westerdykella ornata]|uniref:PIN domain-containing protein n=1 Tax=Westerdykella ornata TaxID=318751 RepID=A0A6A6JM37_WESOR|nr:uncharacterized protein EI97DRAFT_62785 [Westerdykella ornata]KAF2275979.1 hypothetical protein EI97DRAFT_62785 [Westerdykella ornata]
MRRGNFSARSRPCNGDGTSPNPPAATRKIFNCIVDETALIAGVKSSTRDGIRKWVSQGAIRLFVPLYTISQLNVLKKGNDRISSDAQEAVVWLDEVTSDPTIAGRVQLEGVDEKFGNWAKVEQFLLPETLLSMEDSETDESEYGEDLESSFANLDVKPLVAAIASPTRPTRNNNLSNGVKKSPRRAVPEFLRPLFDHILWRIHQESNPDAALESFILLTNDPEKQEIAQKFGIRAKRLENLRTAIAREDLEYRNHQIFDKIEKGEVKSRSSKEDLCKEDKDAVGAKAINGHESDSGDEDEVVFKPVPRAPQADIADGQRVMDPDDFGRSPPQRRGYGGRGGRGSRGRGAFAAFNPPRGPGGAPRGRSSFGPRGGAGFHSQQRPSQTPRPAARPIPDANTILDPDAFERPAPRMSNGRGGRRKLWEPN